MSYSQNDEESVIINELTRMGVSTGKLLDIGAYCTEAFSNSRALIENGWSGVLIEPSPVPFLKLAGAYADNPNVTLINAAVSTNKAKLVRWYDSNGDALSTTCVEHKTKWEAARVKFSVFWIYMLPMIDIFDQFGFDFDFISVDVESTNFDMFRALPWNALKNTKIVCVEHDGFHGEMAAHAAEFGFKPIKLNAENLILSRA